MRKLALLLAVCPAALMANDIPLTSDVTAVTLYPSGATVTRQVPFSAPEGAHQLILTDLPPSTPLQSVRVKVDGAVMGSVTTRKDFVPPRTDQDNAAITAAEERVEQAEAALRAGFGAVQAIRLEVEAANARVQFLTRLGDSDSMADLSTESLRDMVGLIGDETLKALQTAHEAGLRADAAERDLKDLKEDLEDARQALQALVPEVENRAMLAVAINSASDTQGMLEVTYTIADAGWQPVYDLKLDRQSAQLDIERGAFIAQYTGENWHDVALTLSTVRPSEQTQPGEVWPWLRRIFDPKDQLRSLSRAQTEAGAYAGAAMADTMMEAPVVEEAEAAFDGLAVTYTYPGAVSVTTGADRVRLALGQLSTEIDLTAHAVPLSDPTAFLMASFTNDTGELILPTSEAMLYLDGRFVGQRYIDLIAAGGDADVSFGPIDGLRLTRTVLDRNQGDRGILSKSNELTEDVRIEVENLTGEAWPVVLRDHVPYSEQEDLSITWTASPQPAAKDIDGKRGVLEWRFDLPAGDTQVIELSHGLKWPDGKILQ